MDSTDVPAAPHYAAGGRRRAEPTGVVRTALTRTTSGLPAPYTSWYGALWTIVIALDFYWMSNPVVFQQFDDSLRNACIATGVAVLVTLPRLRLRRPSWTVMAVLGYGYLSAFWSQDPGATVEFTTIFLVVALVATVVATNAGARTVAQGMVLGGVLFLTVSFYALHEKVLHADVPLGNTGYLAGVGGNRNILAYTMLLSLAFAVSFIPRQWWARLLWSLATGFLVLGLYLSQSGTGYVAALILVAAGGMLALTDRRRRPKARNAGRRWSVRALAVLILVGVVLGIELLSKLLGRDTATLSGRVPLWEAIWSSTTGVDRWFGSGWGVVWPHSWIAAPPSAAYGEIIDRTGYVLYHGHSSLFDLIPEVGLVGVAVYALTYAHAVMRALRLRDPRRPSNPNRQQAARATLLGVLALLLFGLTEPMSTVPLGWFVIVILATGLVPTSPRPRRRRRAVGRAGTSRQRAGSGRAGTPTTVDPGSTSRTAQAAPPTVEPRPTRRPLSTMPPTPTSTPVSITQSPEIDASGLRLT